jgi:hypothetical protein
MDSFGIPVSVQDSWMRQTTATLRSINVGIQKLANELRMKRRGSFSSTDSDSGAEESEIGAEDDNDKDQEAQQVDCIPEARRCDLMEYREWFKGQTRHVLDFLVAGNDLVNEIEVWEDRHSAMLRSTLSNAKNEKAQGSKTQSKVPPMTEKSDTSKDLVDDRWIHTIRINSAVVIRMLRQLAANEGITMQQDFEHQPLVVYRPFSFLVHHHTNMKAWLAELQEQPETERTQLDSPLEPYNLAASLKQAQCYVDFVDERLIPATKRWTNMAELKQQQPRIRFDDLWYLFQPGDLVYTGPSNSTEISNGRTSSTYHFIQRVHALRNPISKYKRGGPSSLAYDAVANHLKQDPPDYQEPLICFTLCLYYIEFDGALWGAVSRLLHIPHFEGEKDITALPVYPLRFTAGHEEMLKQAAADGEGMIKAIQERHGSYRGWSLISNPLGYVVIDSMGRPVINPTHIEGDVLVDFAEAFNTFPPWRLSFFSGSTAASGNIGTIGWRKDFPNIEWTDKQKTNAEIRIRGRVVVWAGVDATRNASYSSRDEYLHDSRVKMPSGEDLVLIPRRFYGYSVWERKFFHLDIRSMRPKDTTDNGRAFSQLQIGSDDKQLIQSLVRSHFHKKSFQVKHGVELEGQDLIRGKGKGLVILLHGVPGVGKTATAEAVAQKWQKPLFPITCGDLGITSETVERALNQIFRLAHLWDCVLLLDEADVFITQRVKVGDLQRNGLVSGKPRYWDLRPYKTLY